VLTGHNLGNGCFLLTYIHVRTHFIDAPCSRYGVLLSTEFFSYVKMCYFGLFESWILIFTMRSAVGTAVSVPFLRVVHNVLPYYVLIEIRKISVLILGNLTARVFGHNLRLLYKQNEIWSVDCQQNSHSNCCHLMSDF